MQKQIISSRHGFGILAKLSYIKHRQKDWSEPQL